MELDKIIRLSVDATNAQLGLKNVASIIKEMNEVTLAGIKERTKSQEEFNAALQREITASEKFRRKDVSRAREAYDTGMFNARDESTRNDVRTQLDDVLAQSKLDEQANRLLESILVELQRQSKAELEDQKQVGTTGPKVDRKGYAMVQNENGVYVRDNSAQIEAMELSQKRQGIMTARGVGSSMINAPDAVSGGMDIIGTGGGMLASIGASAATIGIGAAILLTVAAAKKVWDKDTEYQKNIRGTKALTGSASDIETDQKFTGLGYSAIDRSALGQPLARARRGGIGLDYAINSQMMLKKGIGLDENTFANVEQLSYLGNAPGLGNIQGSIAGMRGAGIVKGEDYTAVSPYLEMIVNLAKEQVTRLGKIDYGVNSRLVSAVASMSDVMQLSPEAAGSMLEGIQSGLKSGGSSQMNTVKMMALSKLHPNASMFELNEEMEQGARSPGYAKSVLDVSKQMTGGGEAQLWFIKNAFPGMTFAQARIFRDNGGKFSDKLSEAFGGEGVSDLLKKGEGATTLKEKMGAKQDNLAVETGEGIIKMVGKLDDIIYRIWQWSDEQKLSAGLGNKLLGVMADGITNRSWGYIPPK